MSPTPLSQIEKFEKQNNLAINVFGNSWGTKGAIIHRISKASKHIPLINLFLIKNKDSDARYHYTWIKNFNRLLYDQTAYHEKKYFCERCLHGYSTEDLLELHKEDCRGVGKTAIRIIMPKKVVKNILKFKKFKNEMRVPYVIYADFDYLISAQWADGEPITIGEEKVVKEHEACSFCYQVIRCDGQTKEQVIYRGLNATEEFLKLLLNEEKIIREKLAKPEPIIMTKDDVKDFIKAKKCWICNKSLKGKRLKKWKT